MPPGDALARRGLVLAGMALPVAARAFPTRPVRVVVPFPPGGALDAVARVLAPEMAERLGETVLVENRSGALGLLGAEAVARAAPDGHTLLFTADMIVQAPVLLGREGVDPVRALSPIGRVGTLALALVIGPGVPDAVRDLPGFLAWARGRQVVLGNWGTGGTGHLLGLLLAQEQGLDILHVGYRGEAPMQGDLLSGRMHGGFVTTLTFGEAIRSGRLRALASTGAARIPSLAATVPTLAEQGVLGDFGYRGFMGLFGPAGLEAAVLGRLDAALRGAIAAPRALAVLRAMDVFLDPAGPAEFAEAIGVMGARWRAFADRFALRAEME